MAGAPENSAATYGGSGAFSGDGSKARLAQLNRPGDVALMVWAIYISPTHGISVSVKSTALASSAPWQAMARLGFQGMVVWPFKRNYPIPLALRSVMMAYFTFADTRNRRIRRVDSQGIISTVAGTGEYGETGDGFAATNATFKRLMMSPSMHTKYYILSINWPAVFVLYCLTAQYKLY